MSTMISEVYEAFKEAGASDEKSRKAAEAIANYENRFAKIEADLLVIKWMLGLILAGVVSLVAKSFFS
ncbi:MAG: integrase [SAR324 cluster bacterium]|nr:integrase [SAR324 cluster bacterium]